MNDEQPSIHEFDFNLICEYFSSIERQGPGSPEVTRRALSFIEPLHPESRILDIGCGTGGQTLVLAEHCRGQITGLDLFPGFIEIFNENMLKHGFSDRVKGITGNMENLPFEPESLDLIWSEGAIYNIGFERGLTDWKKFLKPGGWIAVTEASWFTGQRPAEIHDFWMDAYPGIDTIPNKMKQLQQAGYLPVASIILPSECWTDHFYQLQAAMQPGFLLKYRGNQAAEALVANERREAELYRKYREYYGYAFYIGQKP
jgi:SAM-dependent methyltransferase